LPLGNLFDGLLGVITRNSVMLLILVVNTVWNRPPRYAASEVPKPQSSARPSGFTLLEMIVAIVIIAVVLAIVLPSLSRWRERAIDAERLSDARTHAAVFVQYQSDHKGFFPFVTDPTREVSVLMCKKLDITAAVRLFDVFQFWNVALADPYYEGDALSRSFRWRDSKHGGGATYMLYPCVFMAKPEYWNRETRTTLQEQAGPTSDADVRYPSAKIVLGEWLPDRLVSQSDQTGRPMGFVDGHASVVRQTSLTARGPEDRGYPFYSSTPSLSLFQFFFTLDGVRGRDVK
jgi:prepilin-type N-terminal cleavage/methylation domain-containing protein